MSEITGEATTETATIAKSKRSPLWQWVIVVPLLAFSGYYLFHGLSGYVALSRDRAAGEADPASWSTNIRYGKIQRVGDRQFLWSNGPKNPDKPNSRWFDMTKSPLELEKIDHGIGKDTIEAIDNPVFVSVDDERLRIRWGSKEDGSVDGLRVIGYAHNGVARAYPVSLLDRHELVNDTVGGKPVTVGW